MCSRQQLEQIMKELACNVKGLFGDAVAELILFGSYAREEADDASDIDVMVLVDLSREDLPKYRRSIAEIAGNLLYEHEVVVSPLLESRAFFERHRRSYPFFQRIDQEGIRYAA
ncbi:MAG: nucleotidyltransferase domain-containing protein [Christensenellales bacterium]|jgi:predicted nucleotidyltransferase